MGDEEFEVPEQDGVEDEFDDTFVEDIGESKEDDGDD